MTIAKAATAVAIGLAVFWSAQPATANLTVRSSQQAEPRPHPQLAWYGSDQNCWGYWTISNYRLDNVTPGPPGYVRRAFLPILCFPP